MILKILSDLVDIYTFPENRYIVSNSKGDFLQHCQFLLHSEYV